MDNLGQLRRRPVRSASPLANRRLFRQLTRVAVNLGGKRLWSTGFAVVWEFEDDDGNFVADKIREGTIIYYKRARRDAAWLVVAAAVEYEQIVLPYVLTVIMPDVDMMLGSGLVPQHRSGWACADFVPSAIDYVVPTVSVEKWSHHADDQVTDRVIQLRRQFHYNLSYLQQVRI